MQEGTNRAIAYNSIVLYGKMGVTTICALLTTRFALQALGVVDFGLYAVLGGIISFITIFNTIMLSTSNRFIAVAIGKGDLSEANKQFNVNLSIHVAIALFVLLIAIPVGEWYIPRYVNYDGPLHNAMMVYYISIVSCVLSFVGVPYNGLLMAKEKFIVFSLVDVISHILKLAVAWLLISHFDHKLFIYSTTMALLSCVHTLVYIVYCSKQYHDIVKLGIVRDRMMYKKVFSFSAWVAIGAFAQVGKNQGAALVVNSFFNTVMNTAMGIASSVNGYVNLFSNNITQAISPQITKSYAKGDCERTDELLIMSTKFTFLFTLLFGSVFLVAPEYLLRLWLGEVPPYTTVFLVLFIVDNLVLSLNAGVQNIIFASGNLKSYQISVSVLNFVSIIIGYFVLRGGAPAYYLILAYILVTVIKFFVVQWVLHQTLNYDNRILWRNSYIPSLITVILFVPVLFVPEIIHPIIKLLVSLLYLSLLVIFIGLNKKERAWLLNLFKIQTKRLKKNDRCN